MKQSVGRRDTSVTRRGLLRTTAGLGLAATVGTAGARTTQSEGGEELWRFETDTQITTGPTVVDGVVYIATAGTSLAGRQDAVLYAIDAATQEQRWSFLGTEDVISGPVTVVDGTIYAGCADGSLYAIDVATGEKQWTFEIDADFNYAIRSSPTVVGGTVYVGAVDTNLYAVDAGTGKQEWAFETGGTVRSSPTVANGLVYVGSRDGSLYAVNAETGDEAWSFDTGGFVVSSPTLSAGVVYVGSDDNSLYAVAAESGDKQWAFETGGGVWSSPTVADGIVYVGSDDNSLYAVAAESGEKQWAFEKGDVRGIVPTVAGDTVFIASDAVYAIDTTGEQVWRLETANPPTGASVVVVDGVLYVSAGTTLLALDAGVEGSSRGTRVELGTFGHHDDWRHAGQNIEVVSKEESEGGDDTAGTDSEQNETDGESETADGNGPGFGVGLAGLGGAGYLLGQRLGEEGTD